MTSNDSLEEKFQCLEHFINSYRSFSSFYEQNKNSGMDFSQIKKKIQVIDRFIYLINEEIDIQKIDELANKYQKDPQILNKMIDFVLSQEEQEEPKENKFFTYNHRDFMIDSSSGDTNSDKEDCNSSVSSLDDINSRDSDSTVSSEDENEDEVENQKELNKMLAKSIIELSMRKDKKDFITEKIDEEDEQEEDGKHDYDNEHLNTEKNEKTSEN